MLLLATLLAVCVIGWEHSYHAFVLGVAEEPGAAGHMTHILRDGLLVFPIALVAVAAGLTLGRRFGLAARAGSVSAAFGLLLVPSVRLHELADDALAADGTHVHEHAGHGGPEASTGLVRMVLHGVPDAARPRIAIVPGALPRLG